MEVEREVSDFRACAEQHLKSIARSLGQQQKQMTLHWHQISQDKVTLTDSKRLNFPIDYNEVQSYIRGIGLDRITYVTVRKWELQVKFNALHLISIRFDCTNFLLHTANTFHEFDGPLLTFNVLPEPFKLKDFPKSMRGYLNRIGKSIHLAKLQYKVSEQSNLLRFIQNQRVPFPQFAQIMRKKKELEQNKMEVQSKDHLEQLNEEGQAILEKIHKILIKKQIHDFTKILEFRNPHNFKAIMTILQQPEHQQHSNRK